MIVTIVLFVSADSLTCFVFFFTHLSLVVSVVLVPLSRLSLVSVPLSSLSLIIIVCILSFIFLLPFVMSRPVLTCIYVFGSTP